jgi:Serine kinase of the HPr protein, regulates carbohydrate metabolism
LGILITGDSGAGKSELALELLSRSHRLIADDAPEFVCVAYDLLKGTCPPALRDFLEVRGLGILNVRAMFGDSAIKHSKYLRLIVHLQTMNDRQLRDIDRLQGNYGVRTILGVEIPEITLAASPGRNLAVMVEAAVKDRILRLNGYDASRALAESQRRYMNT